MRLSFIIILLFITAFAEGQGLSNLRIKFIETSTDTITLDTLSIAPGTFRMKAKGNQIDTSAFTLDFGEIDFK